KELGPTCDVYALGAILYECLTGRPPFKAATLPETLVQVVTRDPVPVTQLNAVVPRDLETICHKCLQKEPGRRYSSARELAEDLDRFQHCEPVRARPVRGLEHAWKWMKRRPALAATYGLLLLVLLLGGIGGGFYGLWRAASRARAQAEEAREELATPSHPHPLP